MNAHSVTFDKLVYLDRLKAAGVPDDVARAHAEGLDQALRESVATKSDLEKVEASLRSDITKVDAKIDVTGADLRTEIANSANRLAAEFNATIYKAIGVVGAMIAASSVVAHFWK